MTLATVQDFRSRMYEDVTLPSGLIVRIRAVTAQDFLGIGELPLPSTGTGDAPAAPDDLAFLRRYTHRALARGVMAPPMTDAIDDGGQLVLSPEALHVQELYDSAPADYVALAQAINQRSGLTQEVRQEVDTFRHDAISLLCSGPGGEVPPAPLGIIAADAGGALHQSADDDTLGSGYATTPTTAGDTAP